MNEVNEIIVCGRKRIMIADTDRGGQIVVVKMEKRCAVVRITPTIGRLVQIDSYSN
jgi:hypothetical protein